MPNFLKTWSVKRKDKSCIKVTVIHGLKHSFQREVCEYVCERDHFTPRFKNVFLLTREIFFLNKQLQALIQNYDSLDFSQIRFNSVLDLKVCLSTSLELVSRLRVLLLFARQSTFKVEKVSLASFRYEFNPFPNFQKTL